MGHRLEMETIHVQRKNYTLKCVGFLLYNFRCRDQALTRRLWGMNLFATDFI